MKKTAIQIVKKLQEEGFQAVFAGGCVRDELLEIVPSDYDIATNATPDQVESLFSKTIPVGKSFGVIIVVENGFETEAATFRNDSKGSDGRRPDSVTFSTMEEDAKRRDFTINGIFFDPISEKYFDYVGGMEDLSARKIRFIGNPDDRIQEDHLRMLRAIRFSVKFGNYWPIEDASWKSIKHHAKLISNVSAERQFEEFTKILTQAKGYNRHLALEMMNLSGMLDCMIPELIRLIDCKQDPKWHPEGVVFSHVMLMLEHSKDDASTELLWAIMLHDIAKPNTFMVDEKGIHSYGHDQLGAKMATQILTDFKCSNEFIENVTALISNHMKMHQTEKMKNSTLKKLFRLKNFSDLLELNRLDCVGSNGNMKEYEFNCQKYEELKNELEPTKLINGKDLIKLEVPTGPIYKEIINFIEDLQLNGEIKTKEEALNVVMNYLKNKTEKYD